MYKDRNHKWPSVRVCADLASAFSIFGALMVIAASYQPNLTKTAVCYDLLWSGVSGVVIQLCDNFTFLNRFQAINKVAGWKVFSIRLYICLVLICTWIFLFTIIPFFEDTNSASFWMVAPNFLELFVWGSYVYNLYFTVEFAYFIYKVNSNVPANAAKGRMSATSIIAWKSIIHCATSSLAVWLNVRIPIIGILWYSIIIVSSLHFLFNFKIEKMFGFSIPKSFKWRSGNKVASQKNSIAFNKFKVLPTQQQVARVANCNSRSELYRQPAKLRQSNQAVMLPQNGCTRQAVAE